jgi:hypothetical protein
MFVGVAAAELGLLHHRHPIGAQTSLEVLIVILNIVVLLLLLLLLVVMRFAVPASLPRTLALANAI